MDSFCRLKLHLPLMKTDTEPTRWEPSLDVEALASHQRLLTLHAEDVTLRLARKRLSLHAENGPLARKYVFYLFILGIILRTFSF